MQSLPSHLAAAFTALLLASAGVAQQSAPDVPPQGTPAPGSAAAGSHRSATTHTDVHSPASNAGLGSGPGAGSNAGPASNAASNSGSGSGLGPGPGTGQAAGQVAGQASAPTAEDADADALSRGLAALAAEEAVTSSATTNDAGPLGIVPLLRGFNASLGYTVQHDSSSGWAGLLTPNLAFRFNPHWSLNTGIPIFARVNTYDVLTTKKATKTTAAQTTYGFARHEFELGDFTVMGAFEAHPAALDYVLSATVGVPTGDDVLGLGAGQPTYSLNSHFERPLRWLTPEVELGVGDSLNLDNTRVRKSFFTVGESAHFVLGASLNLPFFITFSSEAFEDLPLSTQTVTTTTSNGKKGSQLKMITTTSEKSIGEDNGFLNTLDIPLSGHVTLSGFYNRSLRNKLDTAGFSLTLLLRNRPHGSGEVR